jgi:anti-sigma factor RsiW
MITRDNYEEFFLLYTDNELSAAEKQEVERFVSHHPDLREEWEALLQCRLIPDQHLGFPDKEALQKTQAGEHAYTDYFLSYIDGELDAKDRATIEEMLRQHPQYRKELGELQQTVSHPDPAIVFPDKAGLYKKEKDRRIIPLPWIRVGVAAAIAAAVAFVFLLPRPHRQDGRPQGVLSQRQAPADSGMPADGGTAAARPKKITPPVTPPTTGALYSSTGQQHTEKTGAKKSLPDRVEKKEAQQQDLAGTGNPGEPVAILPRTADPEKGARDANPAATLPDRSLPAVGDMTANVHLAVQTGIPKEQSSFATQALQEEANDQQNNNFVADEPATPAKGKLRGIFRTVTRVFGKTADRDKDGNRQVLVGAFQFALN